MTEEKKLLKTEVMRVLEGLREFKRLDGTITLQREVLVTVEGSDGMYFHWIDLPKIQQEEPKPGNDNADKKD